MKKIFFLIISVILVGCNSTEDESFFWINEAKNSVLILISKQHKWSSYYYRIDKRNIGDYEIAHPIRKGNKFIVRTKGIKFFFDKKHLYEIKQNQKYHIKYNKIPVKDMYVILNELQNILDKNKQMWSDIDYSEQLNGIATLLAYMADSNAGTIVQDVSTDNIIRSSQFTYDKIIKLKETDPSSDIIDILRLFL